MSERPDRTDEDSRFDLQQMLKELEAEITRQAKGPVEQSDILKMFRKKKPRDQDG